MRQALWTLDSRHVIAPDRTPNFMGNTPPTTECLFLHVNRSFKADTRSDWKANDQAQEDQTAFIGWSDITHQ